MVQVRNGTRSAARPHTPRQQTDWPIVIMHRTIRFTLARPSKLESGLWCTMCSAVARQCNAHRTVFLATEPTADKARALLVRWIRSLPLDQLV